MIAYRVGVPGWRIAARLGMPLKVVAEVTYDNEAKVYAAYTSDFKPYLGIGTEAPTIEELVRKLNELYDEGLYEAFKKKEHYSIIPYFHWATVQ